MTDVLERLKTVKEAFAVNGDGFTSRAAQDAIEEIERLRASPWVSVEERLPNEGESVLVYHPAWSIGVGFYRGALGHGWDTPFLLDDMPTHWAPLPALPQEEEA